MVHFNWLVEEKDDWSVSDVATGLQNFLICLEMLPLAIAHIKSFGYKSYVEEGQDIIEINDPGAVQMSMWSRFVYISNFGDVFKDTFEALKKGPRRNVQSGGFTDLPNEEKKKYVVKQGWLYKRGEDVVKIWKLRYCLLINKPKGLIYFKKNPFERDLLTDIEDKLKIDLTKLRPVKARGFVDFSELIGVTPHRKNMERFTIGTKPRKWHFKAKSTRERDEWMQEVENLGGVTIGADTVLMDVPLDDIGPSGLLDDPTNF